MAKGKGQMVNVGKNQGSPSEARAADFPVRKASAFHSQSSDGAGKDQLVPWKGASGTRHIEDGGPGSGSGTPVGDRSGVASAFPIVKGKGESDSGSPSSVSIPDSVDLSKGHVCGNEYVAGGKK